MISPGKARLYLHTVSKLRAGQIYFRGVAALRQRLNIPRGPETKDSFAAPERASLKARRPFQERAGRVSFEYAKNSFKFLNEISAFGAQIDWRCPEKGRLWRYNLHYFDYLESENSGPAVGLNLIRDWIRQNPPGTADSWDPFPISLRIVNWTKFLSNLPSPDDIAPEIINSAYLQTLWLEGLLEYHLLGNHLFKNAKALVFCGLFFRGDDAERWLSKGLAILDEQIDEQILPDGGHFERSPMYHSMILEDCLDLLNVCADKPHAGLNELAARLRNRLPEMMRYLSGMSHPDGQIALFNDAAFGIEAPPAQLVNYYEQLLGEPAPEVTGLFLSFPDSGYFVMSPRTGEKLIIDCGPVGPDYQPGHSHCDTLSFELSIKGRRVIVDSGCFQYEDGPIRQYNRGNLGHNTVTVDGENQSEVWGAHRCARRARPLYARFACKNEEIFFEGAHDGYRRLRGRPIHHRRITHNGNTYAIADELEGRGCHSIASRLHINPAMTVDSSSNEAIIRHQGDFLAAISSPFGHPIQRAVGWYCPEFGIKEPCCVLSVSLAEASLPCDTGWVIRT